MSFITLYDIPEDELRRAIAASHFLFRYVDITDIVDQHYEEFILKCCQANGLVIMYIAYPSEEMQKAAIRSNPESFLYIKNPTEEIKKFYENNKKRKY